ncbi:hypothetical protein SHKM778_51350 [Streptomyces sp. KM77-8]|uniref:Putative sensor domain-containing protein n=1 Tax=Streptomyces haneummycinicus TaxID=3074435 RepID=A0AAT9HMV5_9ACTN
MVTQDETSGNPTGAVSARARAALDALENLLAGMGTALLALLAALWLALTAVACLAGVGLLLLPSALHATRAVADRERTRLSRWGPELISPRNPRRDCGPPSPTAPYAANSAGSGPTPSSASSWA